MQKRCNGGPPCRQHCFDERPARIRDGQMDFPTVSRHPNPGDQFGGTQAIGESSGRRGSNVHSGGDVDEPLWTLVAQQVEDS
jgi:hypothetical protein